MLEIYFLLPGHMAWSYVPACSDGAVILLHTCPMVCFTRTHTHTYGHCRYYGEVACVRYYGEVLQILI